MQTKTKFENTSFSRWLKLYEKSTNFFSKIYNHVSTKTKNDWLDQRLQAKQNKRVYPLVTNWQVSRVVRCVKSRYGKIQGMNISKSSFFSKLNNQIDFDKKPMFTLLVSAHIITLVFLINKIIIEGLI